MRVFIILDAFELSYLVFDSHQKARDNIVATCVFLCKRSDYASDEEHAEALRITAEDFTIIERDVR